MSYSDLCEGIILEKDLKISIVVPVYKAEKVVARCIDSILKQTYDNFELILVDDGSPDKSGQICDEYAGKDNRIKAVHKENQGPSSAVLCGLKYVTGEYVFFVDGDDYIEPKTLECLSSELKQVEGEVICSNYVEDRNGGRIIPVTMAAKPGVYEGKALDKLKENLIGHENRPIFLSRCFKLYSTRLVLDNLHFLDPTIRMGDDVNMITPVLLDAKRIVVMENAYFYHYVFYGNSLVHSYDEGLYDNCVRLRDKLAFILEEKKISSPKDKADAEFLTFLFLCIKAQLRRSASIKTIASQIKAYCNDGNNAQIINDYSKEITSPVNKILTFVCKRPNIARVAIAYTIFKLRDSLQK